MAPRDWVTVSVPTLPSILKGVAMPSRKKSSKTTGRIQDLRPKKVSPAKAQAVKGGMTKQEFVTEVANRSQMK
jgi:hypothetical protein